MTAILTKNIVKRPGIILKDTSGNCPHKWVNSTASFGDYVVRVVSLILFFFFVLACPLFPSKIILLHIATNNYIIFH